MKAHVSACRHTCYGPLCIGRCMHIHLHGMGMLRPFLAAAALSDITQAEAGTSRWPPEMARRPETSKPLPESGTGRRRLQFAQVRKAGWRSPSFQSPASRLQLRVLGARYTGAFSVHSTLWHGFLSWAARLVLLLHGAGFNMT